MRVLFDITNWLIIVRACLQVAHLILLLLIMIPSSVGYLPWTMTSFIRDRLWWFMKFVVVFLSLVNYGLDIFRTRYILWILVFLLWEESCFLCRLFLELFFASIIILWGNFLLYLILFDLRQRLHWALCSITRILI